MNSESGSAGTGLSVPMEDLYEVAVAQLDCSRATFSGFRVGAALLSGDQSISGFNGENSS